MSDCKVLKIDYEDGTLNFKHLDGVFTTDMSLKLSLMESGELLELFRQALLEHNTHKVITFAERYEFDVANYNGERVQIYATDLTGEVPKSLGEFRYDRYSLGMSVSGGISHAIFEIMDMIKKQAEEEHGSYDYHSILKIEYTDALVFKHVQGFMYVHDVTLKLTKREAINLLTEIREAMRDRSDFSIITAGCYDLSISTYNCERVKMSILEHAGEMSRPLGGYSYDRFIQGKSVLEGLTATISSLSRQEEA